MDYKKEMSVLIRDPNQGHQRLGKIEIQYWGKKSRFKRAIKLLAIYWFAAICAVLIPLVHFFLVPALFIAGPVMAYRVAGQESVILGGTGICPRCDIELVIVRAPHRLPFEERCSACQGDFKVGAVNSMS